MPKLGCGAKERRRRNQVGPIYKFCIFVEEDDTNSCSDRTSSFKWKTLVEENQFSVIACFYAFSNADFKCFPESEFSYFPFPFCFLIKELYS